MRPALFLSIGVVVASAALADPVRPADSEGPHLAKSSQTRPMLPAPKAGQEVERLSYDHRGEPEPDEVFLGSSGRPTSLKAFRGRPVLLNLWATWCVPCVRELPSLERLAAREGAHVAVVALSQDREGLAKVKPFLAMHGLNELGAYADPTSTLQSRLRSEGLPVTVLYDRKGREVWRASGGMDWSSAEAARFIAQAAG
jgi:thiol-disulfide isomerase/thioredoxin